MLRVNVSVGEALDKVSILEIKKEKITESAANANVREELASLVGSITLSGHGSFLGHEMVEKLRKVNRELWRVEDSLRVLETEQNFGNTFIELARSVYRLNDERARIKRVLNVESDSKLTEEKSYLGAKTLVDK